MKHLFFTLLIGAATLANAQTTKDNLNVQQSKETEKTSYGQPQQFANAEEIAKELAISPADAEKVWTKYTEYKSAKKNLMEKRRESMKSIKSGNEKMSDKDYEIAFRTSLATQRERIDLDEAYYDQFLKIIPASKVNQLLMNERNNRKNARNNEEKPDQTRTRTRDGE